MTPHNYRKNSITGFILLMLLVMILLAASSCAPKYQGCPSHRGMSGYGWLKNRNTKEVFILDSCGTPICTFKDGKNLFHSKQTF